MTSIPCDFTPESTETLAKLAAAMSLSTSLAIRVGVKPHQAIYSGIVNGFAHADVSMEALATFVEECRAMRERAEAERLASVEVEGGA